MKVKESASTKFKFLVVTILFIFSFQHVFAQINTEELDQEIWTKALEIAKRNSLIDCHSHDLFKRVSTRFPKQVTYEMAAKSHMNGILNSFPLDPRKKDDPVAHIIGEIKSYSAKMNVETEQVKNPKDLLKSTEEFKLKLLFGLEYSYGMFNGKLETLDTYYNMGVRSIGLTSRGKDSIYIQDDSGYQITEFGEAIIGKMNTLGIACDITHLPEFMRTNVIEISDAPVYVSHANVRQVVNSSFNVGKENLKLLISKGGVICLSFYSEYVSKDCLAMKDSIKNFMDKPRANIEDLIDHIDYVKENYGIESVCIGSDYGGSGRIAPKGLETIEGFPLIIYHMLKRGYSEKEISMVMGLNFVSYLERVASYSKG